jgi:hypothetical protein
MGVPHPQQKARRRLLPSAVFTQYEMRAGAELFA